MDADEQTEKQGPGPCSFRQEDCFMFSLLLVNEKNVTPERGHFLPQCHNLNRLGGSLLDTASYKTSRPNALCILKVFSLKIYFSPFELDTYIQWTKTIQIINC